jgi:hypothetical protein
MQPESKLLSIPDFNPLPMRIIQILTLTGCCLLISFYSYSQNLQFNSAVFYEYGGGNEIGSSNIDIVTTGTLTVNSSQVLKITSMGGSIQNGVTLITSALVFGFINQRGIGNANEVTEVYLPSGTYNVGFSDLPGASGEVKGYISGVLYDIVP